ncbi:MAG: hypothetical protein Ct9H300mP16_16390 [Pseudomonadota bacterium]|nr:MAG: hypothetical protein Ct9H300mP16_16390 [Pseudomonadota bacterium]
MGWSIQVSTDFQSGMIKTGYPVGNQFYGVVEMTGWQWFWTLVGFLLLILVLVFLYFFQPFEDLFTLVLNGVSYNNAIFWAALIIRHHRVLYVIHWHAYKVHIVQQRSIESMVLTSLRGSTFTAILLSGGATLQAVQKSAYTCFRAAMALMRTSENELLQRSP